MFDHLMLNVSNRKESMKVYTPVLQILGINAPYDEHEYTVYGTDRPQFWLRESKNEDVTRKAHLAFSAASREQVDQFYRTALSVGGRSNGTPGLRGHGPEYYAACVLDIEGTNIQAACTT